jgi:transposase
MCSLPRVTKSDIHDAEGLAQIARTSWFKRLHMKASATRINRAALTIRVQWIRLERSWLPIARAAEAARLRMGTASKSGQRDQRLAALRVKRPILLHSSRPCK